jgi:AcrR family transcriptional regulator
MNGRDEPAYAAWVDETTTDTDDPATQSGIGQRRAAAQGQKNAGYEDRRSEILLAAGSLFRTGGYRGTSIGKIASAVGTDRATIYYYFSSKEEVFDVLVTDVVKANLAIAEGIRDSPLPATDKLRNLVVGLMESYAEHYPFLYVYLQENMAHVDPKRKAWASEMRRVNRQYEGAVTDMIKQGIDEGSIRDVGEPWVLAYGLMGMVSWTHRWFNPQTTEVDARTIGESYAEVLLAGLASGGTLPSDRG